VRCRRSCSTASSTRKAPRCIRRCTAAADGDQAPAHDHDGDAGHDAFGHGCCHNLSSGAAAAAPIVSLPVGAIVPVAPAVHPYRFFPELLKRPPLADLV
jgi:hypothetical protein